MAKFKVGDRVKMVRSVERNSLDKPKIGTVHTIIQDMGESCFPEIKRWYGAAGFKNIAETEYELVVEEGCPFKRGDRVKHQDRAGITTVAFVPGMLEYDMLRFADAEKGFQTVDYGWDYYCFFELVEEECEPCGETTSGKTAYEIILEHSDIMSRAYANRIDTGFMGECDGFKIYQSKDLPINNKQTFMSKATNYIKNLTLSADEKLLRKYGFKDSCGDYTSEAMDLVEAKLVKDNEDYLIEIAKGLELEAKDSK